LEIPGMGYRMVVLKNNPSSLEFVIVHATTGEILQTQNLDSYPIVPAAAQRSQQ